MKNLTPVQISTAKPARLAALKQSFQDWMSSSDPLLRLSRRLATSLSLDHQLAVIADEFAASVPFDAMQYRHQIANRDFVFVTGKGGPHHSEYRLSVDGQTYGTLTFHRRQRFTEEELAGLEMLISASVCHLRNACHHIAIEQAALTDSLTGVGNKRALESALTQAAALADRKSAEWSLILCDLDHFKQVNDTHGHVIGDHILKRTAEQVERAVRTSDTVYRFGGEEFAVLLPHTNEREARDVADRIRELVASISVDSGTSSLTVTASCGVAMHSMDETSDQWLARADQALYRAKAHGRNCTRLFATIG